MPSQKKQGKKVQITLGSKSKTGASANEPHQKSSEDDALATWLTGEGGDDELGTWMGDANAGKPKPDGGSPSPKAQEPKPKEEGQDALRKWLSGEDETLEDWLGQKPLKPKTKSADVGPIGKQLTEKDKLLDQREQAIKKKEDELEGLRMEMEETKKAMGEAIKKIDVGEFDAIKILEETARLNKDLNMEVRKRKQLEEEVMQVKKGSLAVVKYVKAQQMQDKGGAAKSLKKKLDDEKAKCDELDAKLKKNEEILKALKTEIEAGLDKLPAEMKDAKKLAIELAELKKTLEAKEKELKKSKDELSQKMMRGTSSAEANVELQQRMAAELSSKEQEWISKEGELKQKVIELEEKLHEHEIDNKLRQEKSDLSGKSESEINSEMEMKIRELQVKEKSLLVREDEIQRLKEKLKSMEAELKQVKEPLAYKEEEMLRREEDLVYREQMLMGERRKMEEAMRESGSMEAHEMKKKLEELQMAINRKEEEIRSKEQYLKVKQEELKIREKGLIEEEIDAREEDRKMELKIEKVKTGDRRLDDLLLGGVPFGTNILIYGPPFTGKEVTINSFIGEGLAKGVPAILVITDKLPAEIREEMMFIVSGFEEYERLGLVKFIDAYSRSIGIEDVEPSVTYVDDPTDYMAITKAVDSVSKELMKTHKYYRLAFRSISTLIAYLDSGTAFKFLQPFCGKRKRERAVAMYVIEKGMHDEQDIQKIQSVMDGMIDYKIEQLKTFLSIKGICDVQSRAWIDYTHSKQGLAIGSFSLDHIR
ncbi:MAG: ATPase domain-containing protein [Thermoplasmata archaeon]|nr:ATPase domain-containing protein [Thermoplasmata archaeon]